MANRNEMLYNAAEMADLVAMRELLDAGADPNWRNPKHTLWSSVHAASWRGHPEVVRLLLDHGGDPDMRDDDSRTPLYLVAHLPKIVGVLLANGADVNAKHYDGDTPLMKSARLGLTECVTLLLDHGVNPWLVDMWDRTALSWCERGDRTGTRAALEHAMNVTWRNNSPPTLEELAAFQLRRMRSQIDEEEFVDTIPDALVWFYFREWEGAEKWTGLWRGDE